MINETRSIGAICVDLEAKGEKEAAFVLDRVAYANAELSEVNVELLDALCDLYEQNTNAHYYEDGLNAIRTAEKVIARARGETDGE